MSFVTPSAPPLQEFTDSIYNFAELYDISSQISGSKTTPDDFKFKAIYLSYDLVFRTFDDESNPNDQLAKLKQVDCTHPDKVSFHMALALMEKMFFCHVWSNDKHSASLALENIINHIKVCFKVTPEELMSLADTLRTEKELSKALLYFQATAVLIFRQPTSDKHNYKISKIHSCVLGLERLAVEFIEKQKTTIVMDHILPEMRNLVQVIKSQQIDADKDIKARLSAWGNFFVAFCDLKLENWGSVKSRTKEGMKIMTDFYKDQAPKFWVFGVCSHYYGLACFKLQDFAGAVEELTKALTYRKLADDYQSAQDKTQKIQYTASLLNSAQIKLKQSKK